MGTRPWLPQRDAVDSSCLFSYAKVAAALLFFFTRPVPSEILVHQKNWLCVILCDYLLFFSHESRTSTRKSEATSNGSSNDEPFPSLPLSAASLRHYERTTTILTAVIIATGSTGLVLVIGLAL